MKYKVGQQVQIICRCHECKPLHDKKAIITDFINGGYALDVEGVKRLGMQNEHLKLAENRNGANT